MPEIELQHITKKYRGMGGVNDISLTIHDQEYFTLLGNTGGGKTTLLQIIAGLEKPDSGRVLVDGVDITTKKPYERNIGLVFENYALFPHMTVDGNISYSHYAKGKDPEETQKISLELQHMLRLFDRENALPRELSGGMQQRVALGRALMNMEGAGILLLDEPFKALDAGLRMNLRVEIRDLAKSESLKLTVVHITNDMTEAMMVSDRIAIVRDGRIEQVGTPNDLYFKPANLYVAYFMGDTVYFQGTITAAYESAYTVEIAPDFEFKVDFPGQTFQPGDHVVVVARNDYFKMYAGRVPPVQKENILAGTVAGVKFMGPFTRFTVNLSLGKAIAIDLPSTIGIQEKFRQGQEVALSFNPRKAFVFPDPGEETLKSLYFEI
jgi:ABC-type Fe3+/spermidine/putrescine transport system ATPase subunit